MMGNPRKVHPIQWHSTGAKHRSKANREWPEDQRLRNGKRNPDPIPTPRISIQTHKKAKSQSENQPKRLKEWWPRAELNHRHTDFHSSPSIRPISLRKMPTRMPSARSSTAARSDKACTDFILSSINGR